MNIFVWNPLAIQPSIIFGLRERVLLTSTLVPHWNEMTTCNQINTQTIPIDIAMIEDIKLSILKPNHYLPTFIIWANSVCDVLLRRRDVCKDGGKGIRILLPFAKGVGEGSRIAASQTARRRVDPFYWTKYL